MPCVGARPGSEGSLKRIRIRHRIEYHYHELVGFGPHRALVRPREGRELCTSRGRKLAVKPAADVAFGQLLDLGDLGRL